MNTRAIYRTIAGVLAVAIVLGIASAVRRAVMRFTPHMAAVSPVHESSAVATDRAAANAQNARRALSAFAADTQAGVFPDGVRLGNLPTEDTMPVSGGASPDNKTPAPADLGLGFIIGVRDGFIAVYVDNGAAITWKETTGISIRAFPPEEQARLSAGIRVESAAELARVLEDYGS